MKSISVGGENFIELRQSNSYYVDKTELLYDLFYRTNNKVTLFTRPRRFGKTLTMSMMESFFSIEREKYSDVFDGLLVMNHPGFCAEYMNQYPVLFISFKDVEGRSFALACDKLKDIIADYCKEHAQFEKNEAVNSADADIFHRLMYKEARSSETVMRKDLRRIIMRFCAMGLPSIKRGRWLKSTTENCSRWYFHLPLSASIISYRR